MAHRTSLARLAVGLVVGCSSPVEDLSPLGLGDTGPADPADGAVARDGGAPDAGAPTGACAAFDADLAARNHAELMRLGFAKASWVLEGELGPPETVNDRRRARLRIDAVGRGHFGLEGLEVFVEPDARLLDTATYPLRVVLGFTTVQAPHVRAADGQATLGAPIVTLPSADPSVSRRELGYPLAGAPFVAEVSVERREETQAVLRIHDVLAGEIDGPVRVQWASSQVDLYPPPGPERYLASFSHVTYHEGLGVNLGTILDWRPSTNEHRAVVTDALTTPRPPIDFEALDGFAAAYRLGHTFHRAPRVVAGELLGIADECCTGAGGTYVRYGVTEDFRGDADALTFQIGGHAYYPEEVCGDRRLLALDPLTNLAPEDKFDCDRGDYLDPNVETTRVFAMREDTPEHRAEVARWVEADPPLLRAYPADRALGPENVARVGDNAPWSEPLSVEHGLAAGPGLAWVRILSAETLGDGHLVTLETPFAAYPYDHLEQVRLQVAFTCTDPRLLEPGSTWLLPYVMDGNIGLPSLAGLEQGALFFVPGIALEPSGPGARIAGFRGRPF